MQIETKLLIQAIQKTTAKLVDKRSPDDALQCVLLKFKDGTLTCAATNLDSYIQHTTPVTNTEDEDTTALVNSSAFTALIAGLSEKSIELEFKNDKCYVRAEKKKFSFPTIEASRFPTYYQEWKKIRSITTEFDVTLGALRELMRRVGFLTSGKNGVLAATITLEPMAEILRGFVTNEAEIIVTDHPYTPISGCGTQQEMSFRKETLLAVIPLLAEVGDDDALVHVSTDKQLVEFSLNALTITVCTIAMKLPNYQVLLDRELPLTMTFPVEPLCGAMKRLTSLFDTYHDTCCIHIVCTADKLTLTAIKASYGEGEEEVVLPNESYPAPQWTVDINGNYLTRGLSEFKLPYVQVCMDDSYTMLKFAPLEQGPLWIYICAPLRE